MANEPAAVVRDQRSDQLKQDIEVKPEVAAADEEQADAAPLGHAGDAAAKRIANQGGAAKAGDKTKPTKAAAKGGAKDDNGGAAAAADLTDGTQVAARLAQL